MRLKKLVFGLPALLVIACTETPERYRNLQNLELPPDLPITHSRSQSVVAVDDMKPKASPLAGLVSFEDDGRNPRLMLTTKLNRAWDMIAIALKLGYIEVLDKNPREKRFQVRFDPDTAGKEESFLDIFSADTYPEANYDIRLTEDILGVDVKVEAVNSGQIEPGTDASAELMRFLHKTIDEKIINRDRSKDKES